MEKVQSFEKKLHHLHIVQHLNTEILHVSRDHKKYTSAAIQSEAHIFWTKF